MADGRQSAEFTVVKDSTASVESPDLSEGWRSAELGVWKDPYLAARKRRRGVQVMLVVLVLALTLGVLQGIAATHYARGVAALKAHSYAGAIPEFSVARVLIFPYRDAQSLAEQAQRALLAEDALWEQSEARQAAVVTRLEEASLRLKAGDAGGVLTTLQTIGTVDLETAHDGDPAVRESTDALAEDLAVASRKALRNTAWVRAGRLAAALLILEPSSELAAALGARAQTGKDLNAKLGRAKDAARHGRWRTALRIALTVLAAQKDFPGAAAVVADARHALAPKPKPVKTQTASTATSASSSTQPATRPTTPTVPPPPAPP
jgi:hypothetical protein